MVKLEQDYEDVNVFLGSHTINGIIYNVIAIQKAIHDSPWKAGEEIGLVVNS